MRYDERMKLRDETFDRITATPGVMEGRPCIRGMRITVSNIVGQLAAGATQDELLSEYPYLERADIEQALAFAAALAAQPLAAE
jgi:uncharacterized protein (DUF433 family)